MKPALLFGVLVSALVAGTFAGTRAGEPADLFPFVLRTGAAVQLGAEDLEGIVALAGDAWMITGGRPEHLNVDRGIDRLSVSVFTRSQQAGGSVRRGTLLGLIGDVTRTSPGPRVWSIRTVSTWLQVPVPGTLPDDTLTVRSLNRPFTVSGTVTDADLLDAISVIRSSPTIAPRQKRPSSASVNVIFRQVRGDWPVKWVRRNEDASLDVYLLGEGRDESSGQRVVLVRDAGTWKVSRLTAFDHD